MKTINLHGLEGESKVIIDISIKDYLKYIETDRIVIITDRHVFALYKDHFPNYPTMVIETGESKKNLFTVNQIYHFFLKNHVDRETFVLGIGGGIVCDITGFTASTFLRGIHFGFISTTLLAQVDASIGGKNGVNFLRYKNLIGTFKQPKFVFCAIEMLNTLPKRELCSGFAEVIKEAVIGNKNLFEFLEKNYSKAISLKPSIIEKIIYEAVKIKANIVNIDEKEAGERRKLNFGHTIGHAIEKISGIPHGEAISIGMIASIHLSEKRKILQSTKVLDRIEHLLTLYELPTNILCNKQELIEALTKDKKKEGDELHFIFVEKIGVSIVKKINISELIYSLNSIPSLHLQD